VILFIGDGMSMSTITAARIFKGQQGGGPGEDSKLEFEDFPNIALAKTYNVDHQVADSAGTATAFLCGVKANYGTVGLDARAPRGDCNGSKGKNVTCILELAQKAGKSTGFVTTTRITHATPAPLYASSPDRKWEVDSELPLEAKYLGCQDIATQFVQPVGININVGSAGWRTPEHVSFLTTRSGVSVPSRKERKTPGWAQLGCGMVGT
jgi:alkaline phosphatase